jgi:hypothetical protein
MPHICGNVQHPKVFQTIWRAKKGTVGQILEIVPVESQLLNIPVWINRIYSYN